MKISLILLILSTIFLIYGQENSSILQNNYSGVGIKAGLNVSDLDGDDIGGFDSRKGIAAGLFKEFQTGINSYIQIELLYSMKGASFEYEDYLYRQMYSSISIDFNFDYIEVPFFYKFKIPAQTIFIPYVYIGGELGYNINSELKATVDGESETADYEEYVEDMEAGFIFGGGVEFPLKSGSGRLIFDIRNTNGLTNIIDEDNTDIYNKVWSFTVGYGF